MQLFEWQDGRMAGWQGNEEDFPIKQTENIKRREFENVRQKSTSDFRLAKGCLWNSENCPLI